ncbi:hypothetical protein [Nocardia terpenica]|uniref:AbrB/MazE/SpoVT family DNA-binding domain-containing protein n=1 Tax=Nocardia terpenica TaxID=455432 RepID=A0A291RNL6_9NOCA|nr:hypothetical protein [Nocardia terpenica]ATL69166.1 hypothetical protein CRH09_26290 [Nocardia terpenica]
MVDAGVLAALQWQAGDRVSWSARTGSIVLRLSNVGTVRIGGAGRFWLPARARRHARIGAGDQVLLAARPVPGVLVVVAVSAVDEVVADAMSGVENGSAR